MTLRNRFQVAGLSVLVAATLALSSAHVAGQAPLIQAPVSNSQPTATPPATSLYAELLNGIDTKKAKTGDPISARTTVDAKLPDGTALPRGSRLMGNIVAVTPSSKQQLSCHLVIALNRATTRDGHTLPIHAAVTSMTAPLVPLNKPLLAKLPAPSEISQPLVPVAVLHSAEDKVPVGNLPGVLLSAPNTPDSAGVLDASNQNILLSSGTSLTLNLSPADAQELRQ